MENKKEVGNEIMFERIRRITGYLVGTTDRWNDAKKSEEKDRVRHSLKGKVK
ncbi:MAG: anaerobic ribonucleoside-triphosphate reductase [Clostridia bacterium]